MTQLNSGFTCGLRVGAAGVRQARHFVLLFLQLEAHPLHRVDAASALPQETHLQGQGRTH